MRKLLFFSLLTGLWAFSPTLNASHYMGADLSANCLGCDSIGGSCTYEIILVIYRDCNGIPLGATETVEVTEDTSCASGFGGRLTLTRVSITDITPLCAGETSVCAGGTGYGIERHEYRTTVILPYNCGWNWKIKAGPFSARNSDITTLSPPGNMYIDACLNNMVEPCNNLPRFTEYPTAFACVGQKTAYNHGAAEPDGDRLEYALVDCRKGEGLRSDYITGLSGIKPLDVIGDFEIDKVTGNLCFTPRIEQTGVICVEVKEYRDSVLVGSTIRDLQYVVTDCDNNYPLLTGIDSTELTRLGVCPGQPIDFYVYSNDADTADTLFMNWNMGIPSATFTVTGSGAKGDRPIGRFTWTPSMSDLGLHSFLVTIADNGCPIIGSAVKAFVIEVREPNIDAGVDTTICQGDLVYRDVISSITFDSFSWTPTNGVSDSSLLNPVFNPSATTTYYVFGSNGYCDAFDSFTVIVQPDPTVVAGADKEICIGESIELCATHDGDTIEWNGTDLTNCITVSPTVTTTYIVRSVNLIGCESYDSITVVVNPLPNVDAGSDVEICHGNAHTINATADGTYTWSPNLGPGLTHSVSPTSTTTYGLSTVDSNGCTNDDEITVVVNPLPNPKLTDTVMYLGEQLQLAGNGACDPANSWTWLNLDGSPATSTLQCPPFEPPGCQADKLQNPLTDITEDHSYILEVEDCNGCIYRDTIFVRVIPEAAIDVPNVFTPNGDGLNDQFHPLVRGPGVIEMFEVFNRWGQLVFSTTTVDDGWDGTLNGSEQEIGTYVWQARYKTTPTNNEVFFEKGNVTLLR